MISFFGTGLAIITNVNSQQTQGGSYDAIQNTIYNPTPLEHKCIHLGRYNWVIPCRAQTSR